MPNLDAASIAFNLLQVANGDGVAVGPILLGSARAVHILTPSASVRRLQEHDRPGGGGCHASSARNIAGLRPVFARRPHGAAAARLPLRPNRLSHLPR